MKNSKKVLFIMLCISIVFTIVSIVQTYAKYVTSVRGNTDISIARWNITVNNISIKSSADLSSLISPVFPGNANIAPGVLAPNAEGYFDLVFDFSEVDVSFDYTISILSNDNTLVTDLIVTGYSVDSGATQAFSDSSNTITHHISYEDDILEENTSRTIRVFVKWNDDSSTAYMNNVEDTFTTLDEDNKGLLSVDISFTQTT